MSLFWGHDTYPAKLVKFTLSVSALSGESILGPLVSFIVLSLPIRVSALSGESILGPPGMSSCY